ncbi:MAG: AAA family ATPase, partial [Anaerolineae bacterium]|nr:AAA family ATPase [Anaerolineae bacterium]
MTDALYDRYRPRTFDDVIGQVPTVRSLQKLVKGGSHAFLFTGPSGCGKTTLSRICARELGSPNPREIDASTFTGIDAMRQVQQDMQFKPFGNEKARAVIIDEAHGLSKQAWNSLLKSIEEPPQHLYWFLCTTEPAKVPKTIVTRCTSFHLSELSREDLDALLIHVCKSEKYKLAEGVATLCVREADGSARQLLVNLAKCYGAKDRVEAAALLRSVQDSDATIELCRYIAGM